jgi:D-alanine-D-alanine ligase
MTKLRVGIVFGGRSVEHEVSVASATSIREALDPGRYDVSLLCVDTEGRWRLGGPGALPANAGRGEEVSLPAVPGDGTLISAKGSQPVGRLDVIVPIIHGTGGEDGCLQGFLELAGVPYVGSGVLGSAIQMDKDVAKRLLRAEGIPVVPWVAVPAREVAAGAEAHADRAIRELGLPVFVKPSSLGSSVGVSKAKTRAELVEGLRHAARYDEKILVERAVPAREIEVGVLGNDAPEASVVGEIVPKREFYDYESKYVDDDTDLLVPAPLDAAVAEEARALAIRAFRILEGAGLARVDFFLDRETGALYLNELNSLPGFTEVSMFPRLWQASGLSYPALLDRLIELSLERHRRRAELERTYRRG